VKIGRSRFLIAASSFMLSCAVVFPQDTSNLKMGKATGGQGQRGSVIASGQAAGGANAGGAGTVYANQLTGDQDGNTAQAVAQKLESITGYKFTSEKSEARGIIAQAKGPFANDGQIWAQLVNPMLNILSVMGAAKARDAEMQFWKDRGYGYSNDTRQKIGAAFQNAGDNSTSEHGLADSPTANQVAYNSASEIMAKEAVGPKYMNLLFSAKSAYQSGTVLLKQYNDATATTSNFQETPDFRLQKGMRNASLGALGFKQMNKAVMPGVGMVATQVVPPGEGDAEGGFLKRNIIMFNGLVAGLVLDGTERGLIDPTPDGPAGVKKALSTEDAGYGYEMLESFEHPSNADFLRKLRDKYAGASQ